VTSLQQALEEKTNNIRKLNLEILLAEEKHRQHIATEFHDRVAQFLAMAKNKTGVMKDDLSTAENDIHEVYELIDKSIKETRALIQELNPPILHEAGFGAAIVWLVEQVCQNYGLETEINNLIGISQSEQMDRETKTILFQSTREILNNVIKHAQAHNVSVEAWTEKDYIWIKIDDDGIGIAEHNFQTRHNDEGGYGLSNIKYRLEQLNGEFEIHSEPGYGTTVRFGTPLRISHNTSG